MTAVVGLLLAVSFAVVMVTGAHVGFGVFALLGVVLVGSWAMSPVALVVDGGELRVERRAWRPLRVPLTSVASASPVERLGAGTLRVFGVGGFFGSYFVGWLQAATGNPHAGYLLMSLSLASSALLIGLLREPQGAQSLPTL